MSSHSHRQAGLSYALPVPIKSQRWRLTVRSGCTLLCVSPFPMAASLLLDCVESATLGGYR